jgi:hypothetical protein
MKAKIITAICLVLVLSSCKLMDPTRKSVREMLITFASSIDKKMKRWQRAACLTLTVSSSLILTPERGWTPSPLLRRF